MATETQEMSKFEIDRSTYDNFNKENLKFRAAPGISEKLVRAISKDKNEPEWMLKKRLQGLQAFNELKTPEWGPSLKKLDLEDIHYYMLPDAKQNAESWDQVPDDIKNTFEKLGIPEAEREALGGVGAQYECLSGDTPILTNPKGPTKISEIKKGDTVFAFDETQNEIKKARVLGMMEKGENEVFEVIVDNKKVEATTNHPFLALHLEKNPGKRRGKYRRRWSSLKELKEGDLVAVAKRLPQTGKKYDMQIPKKKETVKGRNQFRTNFDIDISHSYNKVILPIKTSEDLMWFLGYYLGDGNIKREKGRDKKRVQIAIPETQEELREECKKMIKRFFEYSIKSEEKYRISINSTQIADYLEMNGFRGNAHTKRIPQWVFSLPLAQRLSFIAGIVDADGGVDRYGRVIIKLSNENLVNDIRSLANTSNLHPSLIHVVRSKHPFDKKRIMTAYQVECTGNVDSIPCRCTPKKSRLKNARPKKNPYSSAHGTSFVNHTNDHLGFARIRSIRSKGVRKVYDIEVEGHHNFLADGIVVHNSAVIYHKLKEEWEKEGVVFLDTDEAVKQYPELVKKYFMTSCVPIKLHKFAALHAAVWSGGTFIYVPKNVKVKAPLQAYFRMNAKKGGQFEHTLIIVDEGAEIQYIEGCSAPQYTANSLHAGCVEIHVLKGARARYSSIENWSKNTYNLNTKRAVVQEEGIIEWVNGNMGSAVTMLYPASMLIGDNSKSHFIGIAFAGRDQNQDTGCKVTQIGKNTSSTIISKSISKDGGITTYRGLLSIKKGAKHAKANVECDALMIDNKSQSNTFPYMDVREPTTDLAHEATVGKISDEQIFYLMSRGLNEEQAKQMIVAGFIEPIVKELPLEYAVELNKLIELEMEGSLG